MSNPQDEERQYRTSEMVGAADAAKRRAWRPDVADGADPEDPGGVTSDIRTEDDMAAPDSVTSDILAEDDLAAPAGGREVDDDSEQGSAMDLDKDVVVAEVIDVIPARDVSSESAEPVEPAASETSGDADLSPRWQDIQARFVDDPRGAVQLAADAADGALNALVSSMREWQSSVLPSSGDPAGRDTEQLRNALMQYRQFCQGVVDLNQLVPVHGS